MNADVLRETLDRRLWGLFIELICSVCEVLEMDVRICLKGYCPIPKQKT
jgi:hypothetical protein